MATISRATGAIETSTLHSNPGVRRYEVRRVAIWKMSREECVKRVQQNGGQVLLDCCGLN